MDQRFDVRSPAAFKIDIKRNHEKEALIAVRLCIAVHSKTKEWPLLAPAGVDTTGEFIDSIQDVDARPDFIIGDRFVEITRSDKLCQRSFHQKCHKVEQCVAGNNDIVFVNGFDEVKQPKFVWFTPERMAEFLIRSKTKYGKVKHPGGGKVGLIDKPAYRFDVYWFEDLWCQLP